MSLFVPPAGGEPQRIEGTVERVTFANPDSGWSVVRFRPSDGRGELVAVGNLHGIAVGETVRLVGRFVVDPKWGEQLRVEQAEILPPASTAGLERWLASGAIKGIGKGLARRLVERFGLRLIEILDGEPERLLEIRRISRKKIGAIKGSWDEQRGIREAMIFLQSVDATPGMARRIWKRYGAATVAVIRDDPYRLALEVDGVGFVTSDRIARASGVPLDSPRRAAAGLLHVLRERSAEGHVWVDRKSLYVDAVKLLGEAAPPLDGPLGSLVAEGHLAVGEGEEVDEGLYALPRLERAERISAEVLVSLLVARAPGEGGDPTLALRRFEAERGIELDEVQREAIRRAAESKVFVLTGGPGTGKTTIVSALLDLFEGKKARIRLASPTGRAARRLQEASGREAITIHRLLEWNPALGTFSRDETNRLEADLVVVDEASMIDLPLFAALLRALPGGCRLVLVGDSDQLPSVGPGRVLEDVIDSGVVPTVRLVQIFRQAEESLIVTNAHRINRGEMPVSAPSGGPGDFFFVERDDPEAAAKLVEELVARRIPARFGLDPVDDVQVLTPMHRGSLGGIALNVRLRESLNPTGPFLEVGSRLFRLGDKVIQLENDYDENVFNGDLGRVVDVDDEEGRIRVRFDERLVEYEGEQLERIAPAWAMTVHKAQGSEYPAVVLALHTQHFPLLERNLVYTAVTRGRKLVVVVGSRRALELAVGNVRREPRKTRLAARIRSAAGLRGLPVTAREPD